MLLPLVTLACGQVLGPEWKSMYPCDVAALLLWAGLSQQQQQQHAATAGASADKSHSSSTANPAAAAEEGVEQQQSTAHAQASAQLHLAHCQALLDSVLGNSNQQQPMHGSSTAGFGNAQQQQPQQQGFSGNFSAMPASSSVSSGSATQQQQQPVMTFNSGLESSSTGVHLASPTKRKSRHAARRHGSSNQQQQPNVQPHSQQQQQQLHGTGAPGSSPYQFGSSGGSSGFQTMAFGGGAAASASSTAVSQQLPFDLVKELQDELQSQLLGSTHQQQQGASGNSSNSSLQQLLKNPPAGQLEQVLAKAYQNSMGLSPLHVAAAAGRVDVVEWLAWAGCDVNQPLSLNAPLSEALAKALMSMAAAAANGSEQQQQGEQQQAKRVRRSLDGVINASASTTAAPGGALKQQQRMLMPQDALAGWAIDCKSCSSSGCTPLHVAAWYGRSEVMDVLLKMPSIDVNARNAEGCTALHLAAAAGHAGKCAMVVFSCTGGSVLQSYNRDGRSCCTSGGHV